MAGKFGIGACVRDIDGDVGVIVDKFKGKRLVKYDSFGGCELWQAKDDLEVVTSVVFEEAPGVVLVAEPASACAEKGEVAFSVGDRVVCVDDCDGQYTAGSVYVVKDVFDSYGEVRIRTELDDRGSTANGWGAKHFRPFTIEAGKFYRTRDGRKVGPVEPTMRYDHQYPFSVSHDFDSDFLGKAWRPDGTFDPKVGKTHPADLVAEWVEPAQQPKFKIGDRVRVARVSRSISPSNIGKEFTITTADGPNDEGWSGRPDESIHWWPECDLELVATPAFSVGARVTLTGTVAGVYHGGVNVLVDGIPAATASKAFPATALRAA